MATITKFNEQEHEVTILLQNSSGEFNINPNAIVNLTIEETMADWVSRGTLSLYQTFDNIENNPSTATQGTNFSFKNDGTDILIVKVFPKFDSNFKLEVDRVHWELVYRFAIYDVEDIELPPGAQNAASASTKCKKFYFWDYWYQVMSTDIMEYSTATSESNDITLSGPGPFTDEQRALPTGVIMEDIIKKALLENNSGIEIQSSQVTGGEDAWEEGESKLFYTAPAFATAYDSLMYVYSRHVSSNSQQTTGGGGPRGSNRITGSINDFSILSKERGPNEGEEGHFTLRPMSDYFAKAGKGTPGEFQIERFMVQGYAPSLKNKPKANRSPQLDQQDMQIDTKLEHYSMITSYRIVDIAAVIDTTRFISTPVHSFDFLNRTFNIEFQANSIESAASFIRDEYISKLPVAQGPSEENFLLTINERKTTNRNIMPVFSLYGYDYDVTNRQADGFQKILKTGIFQNLCIHFRTLGSTNRCAGRFIAIDQKEGIDDTDFNNKFFGQWFVINVKHIFEAGVYYNEIAAIKIHRFKPPLTS